INKLVGQLPENLPAPVVIVVHMASTSSADFIAYQLQKFTKLRRKVAVNKELIKEGTIYLAPADHHMLVSRNYIIVTKGPRQNQFRPAIDPLFRSAAASYGKDVIGIVLTGLLQDG